MATSWFCDFTNGNDTTGTGTSLLPYKTLQKAINVSNGGDTINVANTSAQSITTNITWNTGYGGTTAATATNPLMFVAWNNGGSITISTAAGGTIVAAELNGGNTVATLFATGSMPSFVSWTGFKMDSTTSYIVEPQDNWYFYNCEFYTGAGAYLVNCTLGGHNVFLNCIFRDDGSSATDGLTILGGFVYGCYFHGLTGYCIRGSGSTSIPVVCNNIMAIGAKGGIICTTPSQIYFNNTFVGNGTASQAGITTATLGRRSIIFNNIITDFSGTSATGILNGSGMNIFLEGYNAYRNNTSNITNQLILGVDLTANDVTETSTPYVSSGTGNFAIKSTALSINSGYSQGFNGSITLNYPNRGATINQIGGGGTVVTVGYGFGF